MALFTEPQSAIQASLEMMSELESFNIENISSIKIGIGISSGVVSLGTIGFTQRLDATVISDTVNIASRCQSLNRSFNTRILVTESVINASHLEPGDVACAVYLGRFILKGKQLFKDLYEIREKRAVSSSNRCLTLIDEMVRSFQSRKFDHCLNLGKKALVTFTEDPFVKSICDLYLQACPIYGNSILPIHWSGEIRLSKDGEPKPYY